MATGPRFESASELERRIDAYFKACEGEVLRDEDTGRVVLDKKNKPVMRGERPPTISGLALALGFASREALKQYRDRPALERAVQRGLTRIEQYAEERLYDRECSAGAKFLLQNDFPGWSAAAMEGTVAAEDGIMEEIKQRLAQEE